MKTELSKKFRIKFGNSPGEKPTTKERAPPKKPTRLDFEDDMIGAPSETLPGRDIIDYEWAMQYIDSNKKVVLVTARNKGSGQIGKEHPFMYGRL